ncbi:phosphoglycerate mutase-like protein [Artomyces pyxidatus]|uniref:Phosphoglycerate mutase-like protein n=1 Tax=Artomyces pyxidatus TaxID=48021 RepID=A0ACB8THB9_9AGAM|nr:phosphoglycerate mutase-like protein [Artomyces pyxidatus]
MARQYEIVPGYFLQDNSEGDHEVVEPVPPFFALLSKSWSDFTGNVTRLADSSAPGTTYKVLILGRHGEGYHNVAEEKYGEHAWNAKWSLLDGDGSFTWGPDPPLTPLGEDQARRANAAWKTEISNGIPVPQRFYCSPMKRALRTHELTFDGVFTEPRPTPVIVENCREEYGEHTCDKRRTRSEIHAEFPAFVFEEGFAEEDLLWTEVRETKQHVDTRAKHILDMVFTKDVDATYISITAHSGLINGVLRVIGRGNYKLATGGIIVVVVKGTLVE